MTAPVLDLAVGSGLVLDGAEWIVEQLEPQYGTVALTRADGERMRVSVRFWLAIRSAGRRRAPPSRRRTGDVSPGRRGICHRVSVSWLICG
jgi:hypothetical protein